MHIVDPYASGVARLQSAPKYDYDYPKGPNGRPLDLSPGSKLSSKICKLVLDRGQAARRHLVSTKFDRWDNLKDCLNGVIMNDEAEKQLQAKDPRRPVSIVIPVTFAQQETILAYYLSTLAEPPLYTLGPQGSEDTVGVALLERLLEWQAITYKHLLAWTTHWRDAITMGFGALVPSWERELVQGEVPITVPNVNAVTGEVEGYSETTKTGLVVRKEGHSLRALDPRNCLIDPRKGEYALQEGQFFGYIDQTNLTGLLSWEEQHKGQVFNARYDKHFTGAVISSIRTEQQNSTDNAAEMKSSDDYTRPIDKITMYVKIIPRDFNDGLGQALGNNDYPELWLFTISGDCIVHEARRIDRKHQMIPAAIAAPEANYHDPFNASRLELVYPLQHFINFLYNSHVSAIRKDVGNIIVYDPSSIYEPDLLREGPSKRVRARKRVWGKDITKSVFQLPTSDTTRQNIPDSLHAMDLSHRICAATDAMQGIVRQTSERRTATEHRDTMVRAMSRLQHSAQIAAMQSMQDIITIMAYQTQEWMSKPVQVKILGRMQEDLARVYGNAPMARVTPSDIDVAFDVIPKDGRADVTDGPEGWNEFMKVLLSNPQVLAQVTTQFDIGRVLEHVLKKMGLKNINEFRINMSQQPIQAQVVPDEVAQEAVATGKGTPLHAG